MKLTFLLLFGALLFWQSYATIYQCRDFFDYVCEPIKKQPLSDVSNSLKCLNDVMTDNRESKSEAVRKMRQFRDIRWNKDQKRTMSAIQLAKEVESFGNCPLMDPFWSPDNYNLTRALISYTNLTGFMPLFTWDVFSTSGSSVMLKLNAQNMTSFHYSQLFDHAGQEKAEVRRALEQLTFSQLKFAIDGSERFSAYSPKFLKLQVRQFLDISMKIYRMIQDSGANDEREFQRGIYGMKLYAKTDRFDKVHFNDLESLVPLVGTQYLLNSPHISAEVRKFLLTNPAIFVDNKKLLTDLNEFYSKMDLGTLANYLCVNFFQTGVAYAGFDYKKQLDGEPLGIINKLMNQTLVGIADKTAVLPLLFPLIFDHLYVKNCVDKGALEEVRKMVEKMKESSAAMIQSSAWLSPAGQKRALTKLRSMKSNIGASDIATDIEKLDAYYSDFIVLPSDTYRESERKFSLFLQQSILRQVVRPDEINKMAYSILAQSNAFYSQETNTLTIPATSIVPSQLSDVIDFAIIGSTIGHEIWHGFTQGLYFDENGNRGNLLDSGDMAKLHGRAKCFVDQYSSIRDDSTGKRLNESYTFSEDLPDHAGLRAAYYAVFKDDQKKWDYASLASNSFMKQSFFTSYGINWCATDIVLKNAGINGDDLHSPMKHRVNEVLKNMPEFAKTFHCPVESPMNPRNKCLIW